MGRGLSGIIFIWCRGYFLNMETWRVCFEKGHKRGRVLKGIEGRAGGSAQKCLLPPLSTGKQRRGAQGRRCLAGGLRGSSAPGERGKGKGRPREIDSPPHLERGWGVAAWPLWFVAAGGDGHGSSVARRGRGLAAAVELEEVEGVLPLPSPQRRGSEEVWPRGPAGGGRGSSRRRRCCAGEGAGGGGRGSWGWRAAVEGYL